MKKWISFVLIAVFLLSLCACGESGGAAKGLQAGFGRANITPEYEVQLSGGAATRNSEGYQDYLYITFIALQENGQTFLLGTMDFITADNLFCDPAKAAISDATGIPNDNILLAATHSHSSAAIRSDGTTNVEQYRKDFFDMAIQAAQEAVADLSPTEIWYGSTEATGMAWVRHYELDNGTYAGPNFGSFSSGTIVGHTSEADTEMQLIKFVRGAEDKKDIVMLNFPAHATMNQSNTVLSADFPAPTRDYIEENTDCLAAYFIAAAGDQVPSSRILSETFSSDYLVYGAELGRLAVETMNSLTKMENSGIRFSEKTYTGNYNKAGIERLPEANQVKLIWDQVGRGTTEGKNAAKEHGFSSVYEVSAIINNSKAPDTNSMQLRTLAVGDVSFIFAPYEMFGSEGMYIKENSPYPMTFVITCAQGAEGYLPSELGWKISSYESHVTKYERGTAEKVAAEFVSTLEELKGE